MVSSGNKEDIILWNTDFQKDGSNLDTIFEKKHENQIDTVCFAPHKSAVSITKCLKNRDSQDSTGGQPSKEQTEGEGEEEEKVEVKQLSKFEQSKLKREKLKEKIAKAKNRNGTSAEAKPDAEEEEEIHVRYNFIASGS